MKTPFMGSDGTIPETYARTVEKKQLAAWIKEGLIGAVRLLNPAKVESKQTQSGRWPRRTQPGH